VSSNKKMPHKHRQEGFCSIVADEVRVGGIYKQGCTERVRVKNGGGSLELTTSGAWEWDTEGERSG
jgi:hypothetical protein